MYGWFATGWALDKSNSIFNDIANSCYDADVNRNHWDERPWINIGTIIVGMLGY